MEDFMVEEGESKKDSGVAPALISIHPREKSVVVAVGSELRVFDLEGECSVSLMDDSGGPSHSDNIRAISFGAEGRLFASAGDDKLVKIWATSCWLCINTVCADKRVSAVSISHNGQFVAFADKFGVVWLIGLVEDGARQAIADKKAVAILGHYCSIITSLEFSPDGRFIATADRDFKIRITVFPKRPLKGAHEIQSFCLGHTDFVSCLAFACPSDYQQDFLVSGSGDSTVRLWDLISGGLLDTCEVGVKAGALQSYAPENDHPAITDLCALCNGSVIAVAIQSFHGVMILRCDFSSRTLSIAKVITLEECYFPTSLGFSSSAQCLWMVMGASNLPTSGAAQLLTRLKVMSGFPIDPSDSWDNDLVVLEDSKVPGGEKLLSTLQGALDVTEGESVLAAATATLKVSMHNQLTKKQYPIEKREKRKRNRNDRKLK